MHADLVIHNAGQLATCAGDGKPKRGRRMLDMGVISDGAVAIAGGRIIAVGRSSSLLDEFDAERLIDAEKRVVLPGFVDPHTHIVYAGNRLDEFEAKLAGTDYLEILANGGGILSTVRNTREASVDELVDGASRRLDKMLACGTTTCEVKTGYGLDIENELKMLAVIESLDESHAIDLVPTLLAAHAVPLEFKDNVNGYVDLICNDTLPRAWNWYQQSHFAKNDTPFFADVFTERNAFDREQSVRVLSTARLLGFGIKAHVNQFSNLGGAEAALEMEATSIDHLDAIFDDEIAMLAKGDTVGIVIPTENFNAGKTTYANARKMIDSGCSIALSTDYNPGSAPCPSMPMAMAIACRYQKLLPAEALNAATINAAFGIGLGETCGSIEVGKSADLVIFDCTDYRQIAYEFGGNQVGTVIKRGEVVYSNRG